MSCRRVQECNVQRLLRWRFPARPRPLSVWGLLPGDLGVRSSAPTGANPWSTHANDVGLYFSTSPEMALVKRSHAVLESARLTPRPLPLHTHYPPLGPTWWPACAEAFSKATLAVQPPPPPAGDRVQLDRPLRFLWKYCVRCGAMTRLAQRPFYRHEPPVHPVRRQNRPSHPPAVLDDRFAAGGRAVLADEDRPARARWSRRGRDVLAPLVVPTSPAFFSRS